MESRLTPKFRRMPNGDLVMANSALADRHTAQHKLCLRPDKVKSEAVTRVRQLKGNADNKTHLLGQHEIQFGRFQGKTFSWMLENCLGYSGWFVDNMRHETMTTAPLSSNKFLFKEYILGFEEGRTAVDMKAQQRAKKNEASTAQQPQKTPLQHAPSSLLHRLLSPAEARRVARERRPQVQPRIPATQRTPTKSEEMSDDALCAEVEKLESSLSTATTQAPSSGVGPVPASPASSQSDATLAPSARARQRKTTSSVCTPPSTLSSQQYHGGKEDVVAEPDEDVSIQASEMISVTTAQTAQTSSGAPAIPARKHNSPVPLPLQSSVESGASSTLARERISPVPLALQSSLPVACPLQPSGPECPIVESWKATLPAVDMKWVSRALFSNSKSGRPELDDRKMTSLWYHPPQPQLIANQKPGLDSYFGHRLLLWMPLRIWKMRLVCPLCKRTDLTRQGPYKRTRMVLDVDDYYILVGEYLHCSKCKKNQISWSRTILDQLDPGTRSKFPVQVLYKTACDERVIGMLHQRSLGNSPSQLMKTIEELHNTAWTRKYIQYTTDCKYFTDAARAGLVARVTFLDPPSPMLIPTYQWFIVVYCQQVKDHLDELKASVTSVFGRVLKMDSTKKITKKLAGEAARTAAWATSVSNEHGQILSCVMTAGEGAGLDTMVKGIVRRYQEADVAPPSLLYVDSHCCGKSSLMDLFRKTWTDLHVRLDIWHFMRRLAVGVTTDTHRLYGTFMAQLSHAIFQWDQTDLDLLKKAKRQEMMLANIPDPSDGDVIRRLSRKELALHCRRTTRGTSETTSMIQMLLEMMDTDEGKDTMGVPLLHHERIWEIWKIQQRHVPCLQDPNLPLYLQTGTLKKGGIVLPTYRCARGSTSLESFHLHLQRFIPGTSASANNFQAYLLEGLRRWNEDRAVAAVEGERDLKLYDAKLKYAANSLSEGVFGKKVFNNYQAPKKYTGELLGIDYLFNQSGKPLVPDHEVQEEEELDDSTPIDEGFGEELDEDDPTAQLVEVFLPTTVNQKDISASRSTPTTAKSVPSIAGQTVDVQQKNTTTNVETAAVSQQPPPSSSASSVGPDNVEGFDKVMSLVSFLVQLKDKEVQVITDEEADKIIGLWNGLLPFDRSPTKYSSRYQTQLIKGRFKAPKSTRTALVPGVQSVTRCSLAPHLGPASWPDANRYQEALISELCLVYPSPSKKGGVIQARWSSVISTYNRIREMIHNNGRIMSETKIQLADISQRTLTAWFSSRGKQREKKTLEQGLTLPTAPTVATTPLPVALKKPAILPSGSGDPHTFLLRPSLVGKVLKARRRILPSLTAVVPPVLMPSITTCPPTATVTTATGTSAPGPSLTAHKSSTTPYSTKHYRKRKQQAEDAGQYKREYERTVTFIACGKCGRDRKQWGHKQYYGNWYCPEKCSSTYEEWRSNLANRGYGKKK